MKRIIIFVLLIISIEISFAVNQMECIWYVEGEHTLSRYGYSVATLDYNADGNDDLVVISKEYDPTPPGTISTRDKKGKLYFYYGSHTFAEDTQADLTINRHPIVDSLNTMQQLITADLNGDGLKDLIVRHRVLDIAYPPAIGGLTVFYSGVDADTIPDFQYEHPNSLLNVPENQCWSSLGDINGDGCEDIGFTYNDNDSNSHNCKFYILYGDPITPHVEYLATWGSNINFFNPKIRGIGNINNDAYDDFIIGYFNSSLNKVVNAVIYGNTVIDTLISASQILDIGDWVNPGFSGGAYCGDINGDGADDFVGDWHDQINPRIWLGGNTSFNNSSLTLNGQCGYGGGFSFGDLNADGYDDLIFGNWNMVNQYGNFWLYMGSESPNGSCDLIISPPFYVPPQAHFGLSTAVGDLNCDGYPDVAVGTPCLNGQYGKGYVFVYAGNANLAETTVNNDDPVIHPKKLTFRAYPNPFNPEINFEIKNIQSKDLSIDIFNIKGQKVKTIVLNPSQIKNGSVIWHANNLAFGVYLCKLRDKNISVASRKIYLLK